VLGIQGVFPGKKPKVAVVQTHPIPKRRKMWIIGNRYVSTLQQTKEKRQRASLLEHRRKQARRQEKCRFFAIASIGANKIKTDAQLPLFEVDPVVRPKTVKVKL